jgi:hypothetical protein
VATTLRIEADARALAPDEVDELLEVRVEEATRSADAVTLTARLDAIGGEWRSPLDPLVAPATPLVVEVSRGLAAYRFDGVVTDAQWDVDAEGGSRLIVRAVDRTAELDAEEKVVAWPGMADAAIAQAVFGSYGIAPQVEQTPAGPSPDVHVAFQRGTDWAWLRALAAKWGYEVYLESTGPVVTGHFHPVDPLAEPQGDLALGFGGDAYRASITVQLLAGQQVTATRLPALTASAQTGEAKGDDQAQGTQSLGGRIGTLLAPTDVTGEVEPEAAARSVARRSAFGARLTARFDTETVDRLVRARRTVLLKGLGGRLSGLWLVDTVRHLITGAEHLQEVSLVRNALGAESGGGPLGRLV